MRTQDEGAFTPHLSLTVGIVLAFFCVATLIHFVGHIAGRIDVDTVIDLVADDLRSAIRRLPVDQPGPAAPPESFWHGATIVTDPRRGYLQHLDTDRLAEWAAAHATAIALLVRPGDCVFPGASIARLTVAVEGTDEVIREAIALNNVRVSTDDLEFAIRQLVVVAVRALSPSIDDPHTAISVLDRLGAALCDIASVFLPTNVHHRNGQVALAVPAIDYDGVTDGMFHMIRQNASGSAAGLIRMLDVLAAVAGCKSDATRHATLRRHADLVLADAIRTVGNTSDLCDLCDLRHLRERHAAFVRTAVPHRSKPGRPDVYALGRSRFDRQPPIYGIGRLRRPDRLMVRADTPRQAAVPRILAHATPSVRKHELRDVSPPASYRSPVTQRRSGPTAIEPIP